MSECNVPRTAKIAAVPADDQPDFTLETLVEEEPKTHAQRIFDVLNETNVTDVVLPSEVEVLVSQSAPAAPKAKAKLASKKMLFSQCLKLW